MRVISCLAVISVLLSACQSTPEKSSQLIDCPSERPEVCTMIYDPVCAVDNTGKSATFSSACTACSHQEHVGYELGECP